MMIWVYSKNIYSVIETNGYSELWSPVWRAIALNHDVWQTVFLPPPPAKSEWVYGLSGDCHGGM